MKIRFYVNLKLVQRTSYINRMVLKKISSSKMPSLISRQSTLRELFLKIRLIYKPLQLSYKTLEIPHNSLVRNEKKNLPRYNCLLSDYVPYAPIIFRTTPEISFKGCRIIPVKKFSLFIPEDKFRNLVNENKSTKVRLKRLKDDISIFQKNISIKEKKIHAHIKNQLLKKIILALDELERAQNIDIEKIKSKKLKIFIESYCKNLKMVYNSFITNTGLNVITPSIGDLYDDRFQKIIGIMFKKGEKNNSIIEIVKNGYMLNSEILSPSQVIISTNNPKYPILTSTRDLSIKNRIISRLRRKRIQRHKNKQISER